MADDCKRNGLCLQAPTLSGFARSRSMIEELISRSPDLSTLHAWLAKWYVLGVGQGWSDDIVRDRTIAATEIQKALSVDPECSFSVAVDGFVRNNLTRQFDEAADRFNEAIDLDPSNALAWLLKANMHAFTDQGADAVACASRARSLSPLDPHSYFFDTLSATAFLANRDHSKALAFADRSYRANRRHASTVRVRAIALQCLDRGDEAREAKDELMLLQPSLTISGYLKDHAAAQFPIGREWASALAAAGVPKGSE